MLELVVGLKRFCNSFLVEFGSLVCIKTVQSRQPLGVDFDNNFILYLDQCQSNYTLRARAMVSPSHGVLQTLSLSLPNKIQNIDGRFVV